MPSLSSAILPPAPEISPTQNSPFRYADQIDNFCQPDDNYRGWQVTFYSCSNLLKILVTLVKRGIMPSARREDKNWLQTISGQG
jgi:hypothetical protein